MAEPDAYLIVALSGRALAVAARRSGRRALVADLFGDTDTRLHAEASLTVDGSIENGFDAPALLKAAEQLAPAASPPRYGLAYGSGLESRADLLARLAHGRRLYGNSPETVSRTKDPRQFFKLLDRLGIPHPSIAYAPPPDPSEWLMKRVGGSGGGHIAPALLAGAPEPNCYFQRRAPGRAVGVSFLGDGRRAFLLGFSEQWVSRESDSESFRFGGLLQPAVLSRQIGREVPGVLDALVRELGLVGLNSLDLMVDGDDFAVLEVNPRPGANLDIFDGADPAGLFGLHVEACHGRLPQRWTPPAAATAMSVVYAERPLQVPLDVAWPAWVADRPAPGASIAAGAPICTVLAAAATPEYVRRTVASRASDVLSTLLDGATDSSGTALRPRLPARHSDESGHAL